MEVEFIVSRKCSRCKLEGVSLAFPANICLDFWKRCWIWGKIFSPACRRYFAVLEKPGRRASVKEVRAESLGAWLPAGTKGEGGFIPWGWEGSQREAFCSVNVLISFAGQPWPDMPYRLSGRKPASHTQARWLSRLCIDIRLSVIDWRKNPVYFLGKVS